MDESTQTPIAAETAPSERKPYTTPTLTDFGSFEEITQGAISIGADAGIYS
jgi:hypothetical protein